MRHSAGVDLDLPVPASGRRLTRRVGQLYAGLVLYGLSLALVVDARLGVAPWDVLHQGLAHVTGRSMGTCLVAVSGLVLLLWIPLRQRPGFGTLSNAVLIGVVLDAALAVLPRLSGVPLRLGALAAGVALNAVATAAYIGARIGSGPRDGLMTGLAARGRSVRTVRTALEVSVLGIGWLLGGTVGLGTVVYALGIGPLVHPLLPRLVVPEQAPSPLAGPA